MSDPAKAISSRTFRLTEPRVIKEFSIERSLSPGQVVVEPILASVCHADLRYYTGQRKPEVLARKLPMALIHEGMGRVVESHSPDLKEGQRVVIVPNIPGYLWNGGTRESCCSSCRADNINYCLHGRFLSSGVDGLAQNRLIIPASCAIPIPDDVPDDIAVLSELCSVSYQVLSKVKTPLQESRVAVFGDGPVGYLTAALLHQMYGLSKENLQVFGAIPEKLAQFSFAACALVDQYDFAMSKKVDVAIDCTGGKFSEAAIEQSIQLLNPRGTLILIGVSEDKVKINTRDILEKGLTVLGSSRSSFQDYYPVLESMRNSSYQAILRRLLPKHTTLINSAGAFAEALESAAEKRDWHKVLLDFHWTEVH